MEPTPAPTEEAKCEIAGSIGAIVQISLVGMVGVVLISEYLYEYTLSKCSPRTHASRSFRTFWFDSYKICTGALVSHIFNVAVSLYVDYLAKNADECAVYALAFYYEACGVPFVQLLQYGVIQYSLKMGSQSLSNSQITKQSISVSNDMDLHSRNSSLHMTHQNKNVIDDACRQRWQWISKPGIYDANRYPVDDCLHCRSCQERDAKCAYFKIAVILLIAVLGAGLAAYLTYLNYGSNEWYVDTAIGFLVAIFLISTMVAPISSLWQTVQWVLVKFFEKSIWSFFVIGQAKLFGNWSNSMRTGDATLDAWLYLAIVPIIMNAFMFFMFSRISRLKLPCFAPKYRDKLEKDLQTHELISQTESKDPMLGVSTSPGDNNNVLSSSYSNLKFNKSEAFKVGIVFMLIINTTLLTIAGAYLCYQGACESIWVLFISMIVVPSICSVIFIYIIGYIIDNNIHICCCCVDKNKIKNIKHSYSINQNGSNAMVFMDLEDLPRKL